MSIFMKLNLRNIFYLICLTKIHTAAASGCVQDSRGRPTWAPLQPTSHGKRLTAAQPPDTSMNDERPTMNDQALNAAMTTLRRATQPMMVNAATTKGVMKTRGLFWRIGMALKMYVKTWI